MVIGSYVHAQSGENFELTAEHVLSWGWTGQHSAFLFQLSNSKQVSFFATDSVPLFFNIFMPFVGDLLLKMAPKFSAEELPSVSKYKKNMIPYKENMCIGKASFRRES